MESEVGGQTARECSRAEFIPTLRAGIVTVDHPGHFEGDLAHGTRYPGVVLPPEEICRDCNQRRLSTGDKAMTQWGPLSISKTLLQIPNRRGRLTDAAHDTVWQHDFADGRLEISVTAGLNNRKRSGSAARGGAERTLAREKLERSDSREIALS